MLHIAALVLGVIVLWVAWTVSGAHVKSAPEQFDTTQAERTQEVEHSSHAQRTNHMPFSSFVPAATGTPSAFRVNAYTAVM